jgi:site-specific recombinase XerD
VAVSKRSEGLSPTTTARYTQAAEHLKRNLGSRPVGEITPQMLDALYLELTAAGLSGATEKKTHQVARGVGDMALRCRLVRSNPAADARPPKVAKPITDAPQPADIRVLIATAEKTHPVLAVMLRVGAMTGARRGGLIAPSME